MHLAIANSISSHAPKCIDKIMDPTRSMNFESKCVYTKKSLYLPSIVNVSFL